MYRPRIIPVLLLKGNALSKSIQFKKHVYIGDAINAVRLFNEMKADELVFLDIEASRNKRPIDIEFVKEVSEEANMPFSVGGGITSLSKIREITAAGAEKVILNNFALYNPDFIRQAVNEFGSSTICVCVDVKKKRFGGQHVYDHVTGKLLSSKPIELVKHMEELGVGEIIVQSVDRDGMMNGYDIDLMSTMSSNLTIPCIALGGASGLSDIVSLSGEATINGFAGGSMFVFQGSNRGVLINYPDKEEVVNLFSN